jgi:NADPH-dependent glutamate synthase beta subunit-like oxidoreductase
LAEIQFDSWFVEPCGKLVGEESISRIPDAHKKFFSDEKRAHGLKAVAGWGGLVLLSKDACVVQLMVGFFEQVQANSCGKCFPCRVGSRVIYDLLSRIAGGEGDVADIDRLRPLVADIRSAALCGFGIAMEKPLVDALEHFRAEFEAHANGKKCEAPRAESIMIAPCNFGCPATTDAARYIELIREHKYNTSIDVARAPNSFAAVCGRACFHPCETVCKRSKVDEPISIAFLKRFVSDYEKKLIRQRQFRFAPHTSTGEKGKVAVIGAGPAGAACARELASWDYDVTIFEAAPVVGGTTHLGIPAYRLPRDVVRGEIEQVQDYGVKLKLNTALGKDFSLQDLFDQGFKAVFLAIGAMKGRKLGIPGEEENEGIMDAMDFLRRVNLGDESRIGKRVIVIGGGNSAVDAARVPVHLGYEDVNIVYRRTRKEMPASPWEVEEAEHEGVKLHFLAAPTRVIGKDGKVAGLECIRMELGEPDESGRRRPVPVEGSEFTIEADLVVAAVSQAPDMEYFKTIDGLGITRWNTFDVDPDTMETSLPGVFAGGDAATGPDSVIMAVQTGLQASVSIDKYLGGGKHEEFDRLMRMRKIIKALGPVEDSEYCAGVSGQKRAVMPAISPQERVGNFNEIELGFSEQTAVAEAERCMRCYRIVMTAQ